MKDEGTDWPERAEQLARRFPLSSWHPHVLRWFDADFWSGTVGVACSGGADSLCLVLLLWAHFPDRRENFLLLHFDHRLRGEESRGDASFVEQAAGALGLRVRLGAWERQEERGVASEDAARAARFAFFERELGGMRTKPLFLGHQRDDIVETQLMRLSRGSGTGGLAAPRPVRVFADGRVHLRPLLTLSGGEIRSALGKLEIPFRVDASNEGLGFYRNRLRLEVLPAWRSHSPFDVSAGAAASRELLEEDEEALECWLRETLSPVAPGQPLDLRPLAGKPKALVRRALREWLNVGGGGKNLSKAAFERLLAACVGREAFKMSAGPGGFLELAEYGVLRKTGESEPPAPVVDEPWPLPLNGCILFPGGRSLRARLISLDPAMRMRILSGRVDNRAEAFLTWQEGGVWIRTRRSGDRYRPLGASGSRKLQDMFVDLKIPEAERYRLPVVFFKEDVVWAPGLPPAEVFKISDLTKAVVQLTYNSGETV